MAQIYPYFVYACVAALILFGILGILKWRSVRKKKVIVEPEAVPPPVVWFKNEPDTNGRRVEQPCSKLDLSAQRPIRVSSPWRGTRNPGHRPPQRQVQSVTNESAEVDADDGDVLSDRILEGAHMVAGAASVVHDLTTERRRREVESAPEVHVSPPCLPAVEVPQSGDGDTPALMPEVEEEEQVTNIYAAAPDPEPVSALAPYDDNQDDNRE